jgi:TPR repeat protein
LTLALIELVLAGCGARSTPPALTPPPAPDYRAACDAGDGCACYYAANADPSDRAAIVHARPLIERGCTLGCGAACGTVGLFVQRGDYGDPPDAATAETWYRRGCQLEDGWSCFRLGELTSDGPTRSHGCDLLDTACPDRTY